MIATIIRSTVYTARDFTHALPGIASECWAVTAGARWSMLGSLVTLLPCVMLGWWWLWLPCQALALVSVAVCVQDRCEREQRNGGTK